MSLIGFSSGHCRSPDMKVECPVHFCDCNCHRTPGMMHVMACCHLGTCPVCNEVMDRVRWIMPIKAEDKDGAVEN